MTARRGPGIERMFEHEVVLCVGMRVAKARFRPPTLPFLGCWFNCPGLFFPNGMHNPKNSFGKPNLGFSLKDIEKTRMTDPLFKYRNLKPFFKKSDRHPESIE